MNHLKILAFTFLAAITSCTKEDTKPVPPATPVNTIEGKWNGTFNYDDGSSSEIQSVNIMPSGMIQPLDSAGQEVGGGAWTLNNELFNAEYHPGTFHSLPRVINAVYHPEINSITGTWGYVLDNTSYIEGTVTLSK
jgi:hypothetical protein